jgi:tetratricopeptide (TPR) repeat protein
MRTVVIAGFLPLSPQSQRRLPEGRDLDRLLIAAVSADGSVRVVEREKVSAALKELGLAGGLSAESSLRLGQLLQAEGLVTGFYGVDGEQLLLSARLIDVNSGRLVRTVEVQGALTNLSQIGRQIVEGITNSAMGSQGRNVGALARWLEAQAYMSSRLGLGRAEAQAYVSPETPAHLFEVGSNYKVKGDLEQALSSLEEGLTVAEKQEDPWRFYEAIGELLRMLKRPQEEVDLWIRAVSDRQQRRLDADAAYLHLAQAQYTSGRSKEAIDYLQKVKGGSFEKGRLWEQLKLPVKAAKAYAASAANHASYAAMIRLFETVAPEHKAELLKVGVGVFHLKHPYQTIKAVDQLRTLGRADATLQLIGAQAAAAVVKDGTATGKSSAEFKGENIDFDVNESGLIICSETGSHRILWQYSLHPSVPYSRYDEGLMSWHGPDFLWSVRDLNVLASSGVVNGNLLLISNVRDGVLHAIDCRTGQQLWQHLDWARISAPLVLGDRVYVGDSVGDLLVLSKMKGGLLRRVVHPSELESDCFERTPVLSFSDKKDAINFSNPSLFVTVNNGQMICHPSHTVMLSDYRVVLDPPLEIPRSRQRPASLVVYRGDEQKPLTDEEQQIVHEVEEVFVRCQSGDAEALDEFKDMLRFGRSALHAIIAAGFVEKSMPDKQFVPHLTKNLHVNQTLEIRRAYSAAIALIGDPSAIPALFVWLPEAPPHSKDPVREWREEAETNPVVEALESLSGQSFGADKGRWQVWWYTQVSTHGRPK